jgi:hypothetical protein
MALDDVRGALWEVEAALLEGDDKYGKNAWRDRPKVTNPLDRVVDHLAGARRHLERHLDGDVIDRDSGKLALAHVVARGLLALQTYLNYRGEDAKMLTLGQYARDTITGFEGIIICESKWLHGCKRFTLQPTKLTEKGTPVEPQTFDEPQLELVVKGQTAVSTGDKGGPRPEPQRR